MLHVKQNHLKSKFMTNDELKLVVRNIPNFPISGIQFKDITPIFQDPTTLSCLCENTVKLYSNKGITKVLGLESRGFFLGSILAKSLNAGFVPIRKPGKLPYQVLEESYKKEYGTDSIQIHVDSLNKDDIVLLHDDLLATGGTMIAAYDLVKKFSVKKIYINFIIELEELRGRELFPKEIEISSLIKYPI